MLMLKKKKTSPLLVVMQLPAIQSGEILVIALCNSGPMLCEGNYDI